MEHLENLIREWFECEDLQPHKHETYPNGLAQWLREHEDDIDAIYTKLGDVLEELELLNKEYNENI